MSYKTHAYGDRESHSGIVPAKRSNAGPGGPKEIAEGMPLTKENAAEPNPFRMQSRDSGPSGLDRVRQAAQKDKQMRFTALLHHVNIDLLRSSYYGDMPLNGGGSVGKGSRKPSTFWVSLTPVGRITRRGTSWCTEDDRQAHGGQAEEDSAAAPRALAREDPGHGGVAASGGSRLFPISRRTAQRGATESVPARSAAPVVVAASPAESKNPLDVESFLGEPRAPATGSRGSASVS